MAYLEHVISDKGVATDLSKIAIVRDWPTPISAKEVRSFLGLAGYYRKFVQGFGAISKPLTNLLKRGVQFIWTLEHESSFQALKTALISAPVLVLPDMQKPFLVETDASDKGIGAVLQQEGHTVAYVSKALRPRNQALSTYDKDCLAILLAVDHWRQYLQQGEFVLKTGHKSLAFLDEQRLTTPWQHKALVKLLGLRFKISYKQGTENREADALSRVPPGPHQVILALSTLQPVWLKELGDSYTSKSQTSKLLTDLAVHSPSGHFSLDDGVIKYRGRVWVGHSPSIQLQIL